MAAPRQEVNTLPLAPILRQSLLAAGFRTVADLYGVGPVDLSAELGIGPDDALLILKVADVHKTSGLLGAKSAHELYEKELAARKIITFCGDLDGMLGGGVATGQITEFCGVPAVGKTQLGIQLAVDVQIPAAFGGLGASAVYIDTEGSFMVERVVEITDACIRHLRKLGNNGIAAQKDAASQLSRDQMLANIHYFRVRDYTEQVKLIVIDSIAFHFRQDFQDMAQRTRVLVEMAQKLVHLAEEKDLAVVLMNHVTTKVLDNNRGSKLVPALGDSWAHAATSRIILFWQEQTRNAFLYKSPWLPAKTAEYHITADGVRGRRAHKRQRADTAAA
ncbi:DNA repair protein rad51c [Trebouxia sp. C0009 RCD-2024]